MTSAAAQVLPGSSRPEISREKAAPEAGVAQRLLARLAAGGPGPLTPACIAFVVAHPDDETIGAGRLLARAASTALVVHVTDGAPRDLQDARNQGFSTADAYARARRLELERALGLVGIKAGQMRWLGFADQAASLHLAEAAQLLAALLHDADAQIVVTHPYEGGHPDHDATAFAVHAACALLRRKHGSAPVVIEMTSYHDRSGEMSVFEFLPGPESTTILLDLEARELKQQMVDCFATQPVVKVFPVEVERYRPGPAYDFGAPPHPGALFYERHPWGMTGERWRALAREALAGLTLEAPL